MKSYRSKGQREPYAVLLDVLSEGMTIASPANPIRFDDGKLAYFAERHWHVQGESGNWTVADLAAHNLIEYMLSKGMFQ
jgi:hypothetical protein